MPSDMTPNIPPNVTPFDAEAQRIIRYSAGRLAPLAREFTWRLHQDIVALSPNVAVSMAQGGRPFCERMARLLIWFALADQPLGVIIDVLDRVGADNWREGFPEDEYVNVAHALVRTIRDLSDGEWVTSMGSAWISCFMWMRPHLLAGARQAAAAAVIAPEPEPEPAPEPEAPSDAGDPSPAGRADRETEAERPAAARDDDDDEVGYGHLMMSMTLNPRRDRLPKR